MIVTGLPLLDVNYNNCLFRKDNLFAVRDVVLTINWSLPLITFIYLIHDTNNNVREWAIWLNFSISNKYCFQLWMEWDGLKYLWIVNKRRQFKIIVIHDWVILRSW